MTVNIENGQDIIDILSDGFVTCLKIQKPVAADWYDCAGSAGKYYSLTTDFEPVTKKFNEVLIKGDDTAILDTMAEFLKLFNSGEYTIVISRDKRTDYELHYEYGTAGNSKQFTYGYYNPGGENLMFTQLHSAINKKRVKEYEESIFYGGRPKAVVFQAYFNERGTYADGSTWMNTVDSPMFILDGHHKLLAYQNLNIDPELVIITKERMAKAEFAKYKEELFFEYEYFLTDHCKQHIISHIPKLLIDNTTSTKNYNLQLDKYLSSPGRIETNVLELLKTASTSNEKSSRNWFIERLDAIKGKNFEKENLWLQYFEHTNEYPKGIWKGMPIKSQADIADWVIKMFGKSIDEIKNNL
ncbi:hypothetical protein [Ferruginibacter sp. SUN106]|uniref:hypothetical protein n=1 Tax=Ferruginibacter sp. SUN106 TaxID=2978348 RepID=UPI003D367E20